jgi:DNA polymerase alpha subunit B N-terminal
MKARAKSNVVDRTIGTRTARSKAAKNARRGITTTQQPSAQAIAHEVQKQTLQTTVQTNARTIMHRSKPRGAASQNKNSSTSNNSNNNNNRNAQGAAMEGVNATTTTVGKKGRSTNKDRVSLRQQQREMNQAAKQLAAVNAGTSSSVLTPDHIPIPTRAMIQAAKTAMINAGYIFPDRTTLHVVPVASRGNANTTTTTTNIATTTTAPSTTTTTGRGGGRRGGGGGGRGNNSNNNNNMKLN